MGKIFSPIDFHKPEEIYLKEYKSIELSALEYVNNKMLALSDLEDIIGEKNVSVMINNHSNHAEFMDTFFSEFNTDVLPEIMIWVFKTYRARGFKPVYWEHQLSSWLEVLESLLSADAFQQISPVYKWMLGNVEAAAAQTD